MTRDEAKADVAKRAAEIERELGRYQLRETAVTRFQESLDAAHAAEAEGCPGECDRYRAYLWGQVHAGRFPA